MSASELKYYNRDSIFWRIADQYGSLFRNAIFNGYLQGAFQTQSIVALLQEHNEHVDPTLHQEELSIKMNSRHYIESADHAYRHWARWANRWFLNVTQIKTFVNELFEVLDWCLEQEGNYNAVIVDVPIGREIIQAAAHMCFRFKDNTRDTMDRIMGKYDILCKTTYVQNVIHDLWSMEILPNWDTPSPDYMRSHGQFLQSVFGEGHNLVSELYKIVTISPIYRGAGSGRVLSENTHKTFCNSSNHSSNHKTETVITTYKRVTKRYEVLYHWWSHRHMKCLSAGNMIQKHDMNS